MAFKPSGFNGPEAMVCGCIGFCVGHKDAPWIDQSIDIPAGAKWVWADEPLIDWSKPIGIRKAVFTAGKPLSRRESFLILVGRAVRRVRTAIALRIAPWLA